MTAGQRFRVCVTQRNFDEATRRFLAEHGCETVIAEPPAGKGDGDFTQAELQSLLGNMDGWIVGHAHVTRSLLQGLPRLQVIARRGVGYDRVDTTAVRDQGKVATIAVGGDDASVADHTLALMLAVAHRLRQGQAQLCAGDWSIPVGGDLYRKTVGIVGFGRIGRAVAQRLKGFEARVLVVSPTQRNNQVEGATYVDMATLLTQADFVTLHAPLTPQTRFLIDAAAIALMKKTAILINTARGGLVDDRALLAALQAGCLQGAGLDVFMSESDPAFLEVSHALAELPNVVVSPHSGASTLEALERTNRIAAESVVAVLSGGMPASARLIADGRLPAPGLRSVHADRI